MVDGIIVETPAPPTQPSSLLVQFLLWLLSAHDTLEKVMRWSHDDGTESTYTGTMDHERRPHGHGKFDAQWGSYEGSWLAGKAHGFGVQIVKVNDGSPIEYRGQWRNGMRSGYGQLTISKDKIYEGGFKENREHGYGSFYVRNPNSTFIRVSGGVRDGKLHGYAKVEVLNGDNEEQSYCCQCETGYNEDMPDGFQKVSRDWNNVTTHAGICLGKLHGFMRREEHDKLVSTTFHYDENEQNEPSNPLSNQLFDHVMVHVKDSGCSYRNEETHTTDGEFTTGNGAIYNGNLHFGRPHGYGTLRRLVDTTIPGQFTQNAEVYEGGWENGIAAGFGKFKMADGHIYEGGWWKGRPCGHGIISLPSGEKQEVYWKDNQGYTFDDRPFREPERLQRESFNPVVVQLKHVQPRPAPLPPTRPQPRLSNTIQEQRKGGNRNRLLKAEDAVLAQMAFAQM